MVKVTLQNKVSKLKNMTKDYAKRRRAHSAIKSRQHEINESTIPAWGWMCAGIILGVLLSALGYYKIHPKDPESRVNVIEQSLTKEEKAKAIAQFTANGNPKTKKTRNLAKNEDSSRFDFYTVLPTMTVDDPVYDNDHPNPRVAATTASVTKPVEKIKEIKEPALKATLASDLHIVQAGSFRQLAQAEALKAQLALKGVEARIQTYKIQDRDTRYRVFIGPFDSRDKALRQQQQLEQAQLRHSLVLKYRV